MIVFDLQCLDGGELFEAWFGSNADFDKQVEQRLLRCPVCQSCRVAKAPMAPLVPRKGTGEGGAADAIARLANAQTEMLRKSEWVGDRFAETARANLPPRDERHLAVRHLRQLFGHAVIEDIANRHGAEDLFRESRGLRDHEVQVAPDSDDASS